MLATKKTDSDKSMPLTNVPLTTRGVSATRYANVTTLSKKMPNCSENEVHTHNPGGRSYA